MPTPQPSDRVALGRARLAERARRVARIRRTVVAATLSAFALFWGVIVFDGSMGATTVASTGTTTATESSSSTGTSASADSSTSSDTSSSSSDSSSDDSSSSSDSSSSDDSSSSSSSDTPAAVTTSQS